VDAKYGYKAWYLATAVFIGTAVQRAAHFCPETSNIITDKPSSLRFPQKIPSKISDAFGIEDVRFLKLLNNLETTYRQEITMIT